MSNKKKTLYFYKLYSSKHEMKKFRAWHYRERKYILYSNFHKFSRPRNDNCLISSGFCMIVWTLRIRSLHASPWKREVRTLTAVEWTALEVQRFSGAFTDSFLAGTKSTEILCRFRDHISKELKHYTASCKEIKTAEINHQIVSLIFSYAWDITYFHWCRFVFFNPYDLFCT